MKFSTKLFFIACTLAVGMGAGNMRGQTTAYPPAPSLPAVPDDLKVTDGELSFKGAARGVQIYTCAQTDGKFTWTGPSPDAVLLDEAGNIILHHYQGPVWEAADGSKIMGTKKKSVAAPKASQPAIDWLLLSATGTGKFAHISAVQRVDTSQGTAPPAESCDQAHLNNLARSGYTANYYFYSSR